MRAEVESWFMNKFAVLSVVVCLLGLTGKAFAEAPPHYNPCNQGQYSYSGEDPLFANQLTPGVPWPAFNDLLKTHWSDEEIAHNVLFKPAMLEQAIQWAEPDGTEAPDDREWQSEKYNPPGSPTAPETHAYETAAALYGDEHWKDAIAAFDNIVADKASPYRAAAAYSAARASLNAGLYRDGIARIQRLVTDPSLREFQMATFHLIGTRAYQSGAPELIAAHYAEIEHLLQAPASVICHDAVAHDVYGGGGEQQYYWASGEGWKGDLTWYLSSTFPNNYHGMHETRRDILDDLAKHDPFFDLVRALTAPTPYSGSGGWLNVENHNKDHSTRKFTDILEDEFATEADISKHTREQWMATKNPLWGYAFAQRTADINDLPLIENMIAGLSDLPHTAAIDYGKVAMRQHFIHHATRLLLMSGTVDEAIDFLRRNPMEAAEPTRVYMRPNDADALLNGGIRLYLEKFDLENARKWASEAGQLLPYTQINPPLRPLLANSIDEMLAGKVPGDGRSIFGHETYKGGVPLAITDLLPKQRLLELAELPGFNEDDKRNFLLAGWLRTYLLEGWQRGIDLLPHLRDAFPELATDIDDILQTANDAGKQHLLTRLMLRVPRLNYRPSWVHSGVQGLRYNNRGGASLSSLFVIDDYNPSDGNWWCSADIDRIKMDIVNEFFITPLQTGGFRNSDILYIDPVLPQRYWTDYPQDKAERQRLIALADKVVAWHPLLKEAALDELDKLAKAESGPHMLSEQTIAWAKNSNWLSRWLNSDKYLPETLHLAVRSTRYGCRRNGTNGIYSREAFMELHKLYPNSEWATKTPYWFDKKPGYDDDVPARESSPDAAAANTLPPSLKAKIMGWIRPIWHRLHPAPPKNTATSHPRNH
jgi:hypothetical protein